MASLNKVFLLGNLTRDPDLRGLPTGQNVCELRLAVSRRYVTSGGQEASDTCYVDIVVWGGVPPTANSSSPKGRRCWLRDGFSWISGRIATAADSVRSCGWWLNRFSS